MIPFIVIGVAAAALLLSGCSEDKPKPEEKLPEPEPPRREPPRSESRPQSEFIGPSAPSSPYRPSGENPPADGKRKLSPEEFQQLLDGMRKCIEVQRKYGFDCPPASELPPGCECKEVEMREIPFHKGFDPNTPIRFREKMIPAKPEGGDAPRV